MGFLVRTEGLALSSLVQFLPELFELSEPTQAAIANGIASMNWALFSQAVFVPIDVVCCSCSFPGIFLSTHLFHYAFLRDKVLSVWVL